MRLSEPSQEKLLLSLHPFSHGKWAHLNLNRIALFGRNLKHALSHTQRKRFQDSVTSYVEKTLPAILAVIENIRRNSIKPDIVESIKSHAQDLSVLLSSRKWSSSDTADETENLERTIPFHIDEILKAFRVVRNELFSTIRCKPAEIVGRTAKELRNGLEQNRISLLNNIAPDQPQVIISELEFSKTIHTVLEFFLKRESHHTPRLISINAHTHLDRWLLEISDSGIFLPPETWETLFESHSLSPASDILEKFEGDISVKDSTPGTGTTILLQLKLG